MDPFVPNQCFGKALNFKRRLKALEIGQVSNQPLNFQQVLTLFLIRSANLLKAWQKLCQIQWSTAIKHGWTV